MLRPPKNEEGSLPLQSLLGGSARLVLVKASNYPVGQRSDALICLAREAFGWENWAAVNGYSLTPRAAVLCYQTGRAMGLSDERIERILACKQSKLLKNCTPAIYRFQGNIGCWKKILSVHISQ